MKLTAITTGLMSALALCSFTAHAGPQAQAVCAYHHTLGDDAIMMFGKSGQAMWHDFFGNKFTDSFSTYQTLREHPQTSCDNQADGSAYWAPSLRLPDGEVVTPAYQKTYYQANNVDKYPLHPFPAGLELLAGDHHGTAPSSRISFLCANGKGYTNKAGEVCGLRKAGDAVQFNIGIAFPNCWDGVNLKPAHGHSNATYDTSGKCPADFPVKIPTVNMNIAYVLPQITSMDTSKVELSLDPTMHGDQREEHWGSIYTAHADFMNGWTEDATRFMTDLCMNNNMDCGTNVPWAYSKAENTWVSSDKPTETNATPDTLKIQDDWKNGGRTNHPETMTLVKFKIPHLPAGMDTTLFKYRIRIYGGKVEKNGADQIFFYPTNSDWDAKTVTWNTRPEVRYSSDATLYLNYSREYRYVDVDKAVRKALAEGKSEISWYIGGDRQGNTYEFNPASSRESLVLMLNGFQGVKEI
ncbi:periplasmic or exported protein [Klebsiella sp. RIT-PI-d]|uniref:CBM96 family carbohydrate-binding protein n=1 Tax=Klebsiella sp. RIT-PI-d TaxID=1681196 RepID=UPI0006768535|nr:DUF1996 domain-containing protein [Klebsiella sp. RIT-PI-d]KNC12077.1 periplasmic or exported protein [Klebsiella sp. RIT-PI-d]